MPPRPTTQTCLAPSCLNQTAAQQLCARTANPLRQSDQYVMYPDASAGYHDQALPPPYQPGLPVAGNKMARF